MPEHLGPDRARLPLRTLRDRVERVPDVGEHSLFLPPRGGEEEPLARSLAAEHVRPEDLLKLRPEGDHAVRRRRLEPPVLVGTKCHGPAVEAHIGDEEPEDLRLPTAGEEERREERVRVGEGPGVRVRLPRSRRLEEERRLVDLEPCGLAPLRRWLLEERGNGVVARGDVALRLSPLVQVRERVQVVPDGALGQRPAPPVVGRA